MSLADDLRAAKALIDTPEKWGRGVGAYKGTADQPLCAFGACLTASNLSGVAAAEGRTRMALQRALVGKWAALQREWLDAGSLACAVPDFNDDPATTHADVMSLFDRAIAAAESGAQP